MATFRIDGFDRVQASFAALASCSNDELWAMIEPPAELLKTRMQESISSLFRQRSGSLHDSIEVQRKTSTRGEAGGTVFALVGPNQKKHAGSSTGRRKSKREYKRKPRTGTNGSYAGTNAEVGFILEYGSSRIHGRHWMENAFLDAAEEIYAMLEAAWDGFLAAAGF